jgi:hypothetical protein
VPEPYVRAMESVLGIGQTLGLPGGRLRGWAMQHSGWRPIGRGEFDSLVAEQEAALDRGQKAMLDACRIEPWQAVIRRSEQAGDERVWVIAERQGQVLYFDDVEWGWNFSEVDEAGRILRPGGRQCELSGILESEEGTVS